MTERNLKIGFLTTEYPTEGFTGGIGSYVRQMAQSLVDLGHSVFVLFHTPAAEGISWDGQVPIHKFHASGLGSQLPWPLGRGASIVFARRLADLVKELDLDILEAPEWLGLTAFLSMAKPQKLRVIVRLHTCSSIIRSSNNLQPASLRERIDNVRRDWAEKHAILTADAVTAVSKAIGGQTKSALRLRNADFEVVPNSVNASAFSQCEDNGIARPVVLFVGRLEWRKGPDLLIRAVPTVLKTQPDVVFRFAGLDTLTAPGGASMKSYLESLLPGGAKASVEFCGHLGPAQLEGMFREASVCVFPSRYEGLPMVCLEAMARGKAILTTDLPGFCELISDGETGVIVKGEDPQALASALTKLIPDIQLRSKLGCAAQETARATFHSMVVAESMLRVYRRLVNETQPRTRSVLHEGKGSR